MAPAGKRWQEVAPFLSTSFLEASSMVPPAEYDTRPLLVLLVSLPAAAALDATGSHNDS